MKKVLSVAIAILITTGGIGVDHYRHSENRLHTSRAVPSLVDWNRIRIAIPRATTTTTSITPPVTQRASRGGHVRSRVATYNGPINDDVFIRLSWCEAGGRANAVSRNGKYFGAWQFSLATWHGLGMTGNPIDYTYDEQLQVAKRLQARSGFGQWPVCSKKLGLR